MIPEPAAPTLREFQEKFIAELRKVGQPSDFERWSFVESNQYSRQYRLDFYKMNVNEKYLYDIQKTFWSTLTFFSRKTAQKIVTEFATKFPSSSFRATDGFGEFPKFLTTFKEAKRFPFLSALAEFEWQITCAWYAQHRDGVIGTLGKKQFAFANSCSLIACDWNFYSKSGGLLTKQSAPHRQIRPLKQWLAMVKNVDSYQLIKLSKAEAAFLAFALPAEFSYLSNGVKSFAKQSRFEKKKLLDGLVKKGCLTEVGAL